MEKLILTAIVILGLMAIVGMARAEELPDSKAIRAIIGEAADQGYEGMLYVAVGIRNRGSLRGVYGLKAKHVDTEPQWVWTLARRAWRESKYNRVHDATHWEAINKYGTPWWAKDMVVMAKKGCHVFYKEQP